MSGTAVALLGFGVMLALIAARAPIGLAMLLVGIYAGSRMSGLDLATVRSLVLPGLALFLVTTAIAVIGGLAVSWLVGLPIAETLVAFAPGGLEAMVMLGLAMGLDPLYVTAHHVARFVMIAAALPLISRISNR